MNSASQLALKTLLDFSPAEKKEKLLRFLSPADKDLLNQMPSTSPGLTIDKFLVDGLLDTVHYSWFLPTLKSYDKEDSNFFLISLGGQGADNLRKILKKGAPKCEVTISGKNFLRQTLLSTIIDKTDNFLPLEFLPPSPYNELLTLSKQETVRLIDFLSLYDLAIEMRQIVETKTLKKIYSCLSLEKRHFLKSIMNYNEPFIFPKLGLNNWDGSEESLRILLHKRGLLRLSKGLSLENPQLIWYICHQLDIGRGSTLFKLCSKKVSEKVAKIIMSNIEELIKVIKNRQ